MSGPGGGPRLDENRPGQLQSPHLQESFTWSEAPAQSGIDGQASRFPPSSRGVGSSWGDPPAVSARPGRSWPTP